MAKWNAGAKADVMEPPTEEVAITQNVKEARAS